MRRVYNAENTFDAAMLRDLLLDHGIEAVVHGEMLIGAIGELPPDSRPSVWVVDDNDYERARVHVREFEQGAPPAPDWHCRGCGEDNVGTLALCWNCGRPRRRD